MREELDALVAELRRLKRDGVSRVSFDESSLTALETAVKGRGLNAEQATGPAESPPATARPAEVVLRKAEVMVVADFTPPTASPVAAIPPTPIRVPHPAVPAPPIVELPIGDAPTRLAALTARLAADPVVMAGLAPGRVAVSCDGVASEAPILFLIHMPGADDGFAGKLLAGAEGELYGKIVAAMGLSRDRVHTAAVLPYRPEIGGGAHREPHRDEYAYFLPYLRARVALVQPRVIVALGGGALEALCGPGDAITKTRGAWREFDGIPVMPTFHISYLIRNATNRSKRVVWEDLLAVMDRLTLAISDKQRGYFAEKAS